MNTSSDVTRTLFPTRKSYTRYIRHHKNAALDSNLDGVVSAPHFLCLFHCLFLFFCFFIYLYSHFTNYPLVTPTFTLVFDNYSRLHDAMAFHTDISTIILWRCKSRTFALTTLGSMYRLINAVSGKSGISLVVADVSLVHSKTLHCNIIIIDIVLLCEARRNPLIIAHNCDKLNFR